MARDSKLSDRASTLETIDRLFARFRPNMINSLLFLNCAPSIQLEKTEGCTGKLVKSYAMVATLSHYNFVRHLR
jgi:hypothetical protein